MDVGRGLGGLGIEVGEFIYDKGGRDNGIADTAEGHHTKDIIKNTAMS